ncbi:MAG: glutamate--tRNA ligase [Cohaesibacteraceae bacterium]|nr:glutamate--tRNA ligase [Cohaesibacteraceae bacterium]MBL4875299.1 glutamate--tRNA ligase [Cohaesibacteraceae bacterium]MBL4877175.1 glutamate--tRNA ligase [Cohaesibacteraceae bacterium]
MKHTVRFAPSPTGNIHIGNVRPALMNWLVALKTGGTFILRYDDTDLERSRTEYAEAIAADLKWLGITPHRIEKQSDRFGLYDTVAERLKKMGRLYPCYETPEELDRRRKRLRARGLPPVYDRSALDLSDEQIAAFESEGRSAHWRFKLEIENINWHDHIRGDIEIDLGSVSDPVLIRADGTYLYTLPSVVDDIDMGISMVIRGEDHVTNTAVQIQIFNLLSGKSPEFAHHNLLTSMTGEGLSKRLGSLSIQSLREKGYEGISVATFAVLVGTSEAIAPSGDLEELAKIFELTKVSKSPAKFDETELLSLNTRQVHQMTYVSACAHLENHIAAELSEELWVAVRGNLEKFSDIHVWLKIVNEGPDEIDLESSDREFVIQAAEYLPSAPWDANTWKTWTNTLKEKTGRKGKSLFMPLRLALTGKSHGPELAALLPVIGLDKTRALLS